jgi:hypothetical protein
MKMSATTINSNLVLTGNNQLRHVNPGRYLLQELDQVSLYKNVSKFSEMVVFPCFVSQDCPWRSDH